jgi:RNA polymerase sigma factor (sigma-70 family)
MDTDPKFRHITNEEYEKAYKDRNNQNIIKAASASYTKVLDPDTLENCRMNALWRAMAYYRSDKNQKFTSSLWKFVLWECNKELRKTKVQLNSVQLSLLKIDCETEDQNIAKYEVQDLLLTLSKEDRGVIESYYFQKKTMEEIGRELGITKEAARQRISRILKKLKKVCGGQNG